MIEQATRKKEVIWPPGRSMNISIVIPTYNRVESLARCVRSIAAQETGSGVCRYEVIIVMDTRDTSTKQWFDDQGGWQQNIRLIRAPQSGANAARNKGIIEAQGEVIFFLDDDCVLPDNSWIIRVSNNFKRHTHAAGVGAKYIVPNDAGWWEVGRNLLDNFYLDNSTIEGGRVQALLGGNSGYWKESFKLYGLFDEHIRYGAAETEMNARIIAHGGMLFFVEDISVIHKRSKTSFLSYLIKSFQQGKGSGYIQSRYKDNSQTCGGKRDRGWFFIIAKAVPGRLYFKLAVGLYLFAVGMFYHSGVLVGRCAHGIARVIVIFQATNR